MPGMRQLRSWLLAVGLVAAASTARAQPAPADPPPPPSPPVQPEPPAEAPAIAPPSTDPAPLRQTYDRAFGLLIAEQWEEAAAGFAKVAAESVEPERRGAAAELGRFAREMDQRGEGGSKRSSGRASFVATTTLASFYAGFVIDDLLAVEDYKAQTLVVTGVTLGGFAAALLGTSGKRMTESMASAYGSGLLIGAGNGLLLAPRLGLDPDSSGPEDGDVNQAYLGFGLLSMAAGGAGGMYLADRFDPTPAQAQYAGLMGVNGLMTMGLGLVIIQPDTDYRNVLGLLALGLDGGVAAGMVLGRDLTWSKSRLTYVTLAEFLGGLTGVAAAVVAVDGGSDDGEKIAAGMVLAGVWGGFALARSLTSDLPPDPRFRAKTTGTIALVPMVSGQGQGVAVAGTF